MTRRAPCLFLLLLAAASCCASGCRGLSQNPSYFPYWVPFGDIVQTHAKPIGPGYYANFDPRSVRLEVRPLEATNQVRTQHVLLATIYDENNNPVRNRRVEWLVEGAGNILEVDESGFLPGRGYKVGPKYAVSYTSRNQHKLTRGTETPSDDFMVNPGQSWCVITSASEGDTYVTVYAPEIYNWDKRRVTVNVRWADVSWEFPPPAQARGGAEHVFTTKVFKATDRQPLAGYRVRYKILDGPAAYFLPSRTTEFVATSDLSGNAQAAIAQPTPGFGVNRVSVEIIRPPDPTAPSGSGIPIAKGETSIEWLAPAVQLGHTGPPVALLDQDVVYNTTVTNTGRSESRSQTVAIPIPEGLQFLRSNPPAFVEGKQLVFALGILPAGATHNIQTVFKAIRPGNVTCCAQLQTEEGQRDEKCATTQITTAALRVSLTGPATGLVNMPVNYQITVTNPGPVNLPKVGLKVSFDPGLESPEKVRELTTSIENLGPGEARTLPLVTAIPRSAGRLGARVVATSDSISDMAEHFVVIQVASVSLNVEGPARRYKDRPVDFKIVVSNPGDMPLTNVIVRDRLPAELGFVSASDGGAFAAGEVVWNLGNLGPRAEKTLTLTARAQAVAKAAAQNITVTADGGIRADKGAALEIFALPALKTTLVDAGDPVEVGKKVLYTFEIVNTGTAPADKIEVTALVPPELKIAAVKGPAREEILGNQVRFAPVDGLAPGNRLVYEFEMEGAKAGDARFRVQVSAPILTAGTVFEEESTTVVGENGAVRPLAPGGIPPGGMPPPPPPPPP